MGLWNVGISRLGMHEWKYTTKATGQLKAGAAFRCTLASLLDPTQYVNAHIKMRSDNMALLQQAEAKFKAGLKFRISKVGFDGLAKQEFLHIPLEHKIDLARTKADPLMQTKEGETVQPTPAMSIQDCKMLQQAQRFDVTALMDAISEVRLVNATCQVVSITIIDDSGNDSKPGQLTFAFFMDLPLSKEDAATMNILQAAQTAEVKPVFSFSS